MGWCCFGFLFRCFVLGDNYCLYLVANCFLHQDFLFIASFFDLFGAIQLQLVKLIDLSFPTGYVHNFCYIALGFNPINIVMSGQNCRFLLMRSLTIFMSGLCSIDSSTTPT